MTKTQKLIGIPLAAVAILGGGAALGYTSLASAQTPSGSGGQTQQQGAPQGLWHRGMHQGKGPSVIGTVSAVNGSTITLTGKDGTTYTVDASSSQISKISQVSVSDIKVGDTLGIEGTVSGSSVSAKHIMDGVPPQLQLPQQQ